MKVTRNECLNRHIRMLDGQWQGIAQASDGCIYFFGGSHRAHLGAPFFRYRPSANQDGRLEILCENISHVCGEDPTKVPAQGKVHSEVVEHDGWIYFGTHLSDYSPEGRAAYTGAHLIGYQLATGRFRDFGVIHPNFTNYSGVGVDRGRGKIYFYTTPFTNSPESDGPHMHRIDIATGDNEDLGLITPWIVRENKHRQQTDDADHTHGQACAYLHVDTRGDCWFTLRDGIGGQHGLWVVRGETGAIEHHPDALPGRAEKWTALQPLDDDRAIVMFNDGVWIFDPRRFDGSDSAFMQFKPIDHPGLKWSSLGVGGGRVFWNCRDDTDRHETRYPVMRLYSASLDDPQDTIEHGPVRDNEGRIPRGLSGIVPTDHGQIYLAGRWHVLEEEFETLGVNRHGHMVAACFTVLDISADLLAGSSPRK